MTDSAELYTRMSRRASGLCERIDEAIHALLSVESAVNEAARSDVDVAGQLQPTEYEDLVQCVESAMFALRGAERIALDHQDDVRRGATGQVSAI